MRHTIDQIASARAAAFALFEGLRSARSLPLDPGGTLELTYLGPVDPAVCGLAWTNEGEGALAFRLVAATDGPERFFWLHAATDERGPVLSAYCDRTRPALQARFTPPSFGVAGSPRQCPRHELRERVVFSSHDGENALRERRVRDLASAWDVPMDGAWLRVGEWDAMERQWDREAGRRFVLSAVILNQARSL